MLLLVALVAWLLVPACSDTGPTALQHEVVVRLLGSGEGTVVSNPAGIDTSAGASAARFEEGTRLALRAQAADGSRFAGFLLDGDHAAPCEADGDTTSCVLTVDAAVDLEAVFVVDQADDTTARLNVSLAGAGSGQVVSEPDGIDTTAGSSSASFERGSEITLRAVADAGSVFVDFTFPEDAARQCEAGSTTTACVLTLSDAIDVTATFAPIATPPGTKPLSITITGNGTVTSNPPGIDTSAGITTATFDQDTPVTLTATAATGNQFIEWSFTDPTRQCEAGSTTTACVLTLSEALVVDARFARVSVGTIERFVVAAEAPVAAAQVSILLPAGVNVAEVAPLREAVVRHAVVGNRLRIAWLSDGTATGQQVRVTLDDTIDLQDVVLEAAVAFASATGGALGSNALALAGPSETPPVPALDVSAVPRRDATVALQASFAEHPLGDLDADGVLGVRDALVLWKLLHEGGWSGFQRYHGDIDGDGGIDGDDVLLLLERLVDPTLPARLHVKPTSLAFVDLDTAARGPGLVLVANAGRAPFSAAALEPRAPAGTLVVRRTGAGVSGQSAVFDVSLPAANRGGWTPGYLRFGSGGAAGVRLGHVVVLIAGQSNAVGLGDPVSGWGHVPTPAIRVLGQDEVWRNANEPLHPNGKYSFGTHLGERLLASTGYESYLLPSAVSGSSLERWLPSADDLFPPAVRRSLVSAGLQASNAPSQPFPAEGGPVSAIVWYQGESDAATEGRRALFTSRTNTVMDGFVAALDVPVIFVQLASHHLEAQHEGLHAVAELQRRLETGAAGGDARQRHHMVVAFDLPRSDAIHLSAFGQRALAERIELAIRQHVLGEAVDGTGPRLTAIQWNGQFIGIFTTRTLATNALDTALFTVFEGSANGTEIAVIDAVRHPSNPGAVLLTLERTPTSLPFVRYMGRPNLPPATANSDPSAWSVIATGTIRASDGGLPLPVFGPLPPF